MAERLLILGGTAEARRLAEILNDDPRFETELSLAGRTRDPARVGHTRRGGFGGTEGLVRYLEARNIDRVIDATHPFATRISRNAAALPVPTLRLQRPAWQPQPGDRWLPAGDEAAARQILPAEATRIFLALGRQYLTAFADDARRHYLVRTVDPVDDDSLLVQATWITGTGPFSASEETRLLRRHRIEAMVCRNSGGTAVRGKLDAARALNLPVVMIERPRNDPELPTVESVDAALAWLAGLS